MSDSKRRAGGGDFHFGSFAFARGAVMLLAAILLLACVASAQVPRLADVPAQVAQRATLEAERGRLLERRNTLGSRVSAHNSQCGVIAENAPRYAACSAEQSALEAEKNGYVAAVRDFNHRIEAAVVLAANPNAVDLTGSNGPLVPRDLKTPPRGDGPILQPPAERLADLHKRVSVLQQALINLEKARQKDDARKEWEDAIGEASSDLFKDTVKLQTDLVAEYTTGRFEKGLADSNKEIATAVERLAGETDPGRRERLHMAIKLMNEQRVEFRQMLGWMKKADNAGLVVDTADWAAKKQSMEKALEGMQTLAGMALSAKTVEKWMERAPVYGRALKFGSDVTNVAYDLTKGLMGAARLSELNAQDELYARRVQDLSGNMHAAMSEIKQIEAQVRNQPK